MPDLVAGRDVRMAVAIEVGDSATLGQEPFAEHLLLEANLAPLGQAGHRDHAATRSNQLASHPVLHTL